MQYQFPRDFLWGAATSAHQVEGGNRNDWTAWEQSPARLDDLKRRGLTPNGFISGRACDHYHRFREDFDIARELGHNAHRFSVEWSRIEPEEGKFDEREIEHYRQVITALRRRGMEPFVTLWHWTLPLWLRDRGGILAPDFSEKFERYAEQLGRAFRDSVRFWMTMNEPTSVIENGYHRGRWPPHQRSWRKVFRAYRVLADAHRRSYRAIHRVSPGAMVGFGNILIALEPARARALLDRLAVHVWDYFSNRKFLQLVGETNDYYAVQYYFHFRVQFPRRIRNENRIVSDIGWELYPEGLYELLLRFRDSGKPIYVTENGLADANDRHRAWYIREVIRVIARARKHGADVRGYFHWSLLDNFEWEKGFAPRFGLVAVDYATLRRTIRPSAWVYKTIIEQNAIELSDELNSPL